MNDFDGKLEIKRDRQDFYRLQINDSDDYIEFDLTDISLPEKILDASENIMTMDTEYQKKKEEIYKSGKSEMEQIKEIIRLESKACQSMRKEFDSFLGEGACQKIFGDKNYYCMFLRLFDSLEPHFKKMEINLKKGKEILANKYLNNKSDVI